MSYIRLNNLLKETIEIESVDSKPNSKNSTLITLNGILHGLELGKEFQNKTEYQNIKEVSQAIFNQYQTRLGCKKYFYKFIGLFFTTNLIKINDVYNKIIKLYEKQKTQSIILEWSIKSNLSQEKLEVFNKAINDYLNNENQFYLKIPIHLDLTTLPDIFNIEPFSFRLKTLIIAHQKLTELPPSIFALHSLECLDLQHNNLESLPPEIRSLKSLKELDLYNNAIQSLPPEISNLKFLKELLLENNINLTQLPQGICLLPSDCRIYLEGCGLSQRSLQNLREACNQQGYNGPRFRYSMAPSFKIDPHNIPSMTSILEDFFKETSRKKNTFTQLMEFVSIDNQKERLQVWLYRLKEIADLNRPKSSKNNHSIKFINKILDYLSFANENIDFRDVFLAQIYESIDTCGDKIALSVLRLGSEYAIASELKKIKENPSHPLKRFIKALRTRIILRLLVLVAEVKINKLKFVDHVETYLAYPILLRKQLNLKLDIKEMLYPKFSGLKDEDIKDAKNHIEDILHSGFKGLLVEENEWKEVLHLIFKDQFENLTEARYTGLENEENASELSEKFNQGLIQLTQQLLTPNLIL
ncbi:MAG: NEL-type E3 ubiquitin ligase domain-containing protein [Parachlamydiaceae bacterium]|nr:NEL-type E3 ubiquitin ligase domain-containing protein [Parachlamydiaceae bacterium]